MDNNRAPRIVWLALVMVCLGLAGGACGREVHEAPVGRRAPGIAGIPEAPGVPPGVPGAAEAKNMRILGHTDLNGHGNGGEGLALHQYPSGRRILFLAHESGPVCFSVIDVTNTAHPRVVTQVPTAVTDIRCNSLGLSNT